MLIYDWGSENEKRDPTRLKSVSEVLVTDIGDRSMHLDMRWTPDRFYLVRRRVLNPNKFTAKRFSLVEERKLSTIERRRNL